MTDKDPKILGSGADVVTLDTTKMAGPTPLEVLTNEQFNQVQLLEKILARAKAGEFLSVAIAAVNTTHANITGWSRPIKGDGITRLVGAVSYLGYRMNKLMDEE